MTPQNQNRTGSERLLERILETVTSIDRNVEEIMDRISDYAAGLNHDRDWHNHGYDLGAGCDYESE
jgi:hypothetical protein